MPADGMRMGLDYTQLGNKTETCGVGGLADAYQERALLAFSEPGIAVHAYAIEILIYPFSPDIQDVNSLLGRDVLDRWRMTYDHPTDQLKFDVLDADVSQPLT